MSVALTGFPSVPFRSLDTLWFQVAGTICNLRCTHCFISCAPDNHSHGMLTLEQVQRHLEDTVALGVKDYYFTGGEPFMNRELPAMLEATLQVGPATVLTNGLLLDRKRAGRLRELAASSLYSLDLRISLDGYDARTHDAIRGTGTYHRALQGAVHVAEAGLNPVITVTEVAPEVATAAGRAGFLARLRELGLARPRLKVLPLFRIGREEQRSGPYPPDNSLRGYTLTEDQTDGLQCSSSRMVTSQGVFVCPILIDEPRARMGERLADVQRSYPLAHQACFTCHVTGMTCRT